MFYYLEEYIETEEYDEIKVLDMFSTDEVLSAEELFYRFQRNNKELSNYSVEDLSERMGVANVGNYTISASESNDYE